MPKYLSVCVYSVRSDSIYNKHQIYTASQTDIVLLNELPFLFSIFYSFKRCVLCVRYKFKINLYSILFKIVDIPPIVGHPQLADYVTEPVENKRGFDEIFPHQSGTPSGALAFKLVDSFEAK